VTWAGLVRPQSTLALALVSHFVSRSVLGWVVSFPLIATVAALGTGALEHGDRALFAPSGLHLLDLLLHGASSFLAAGYSAFLLLLLASLLHTLPTALLFAALAHPDGDYRSALRRAAGKLPRFLGLGALELALLGFGAGVAWFAWAALRPSQAEWRTFFDVAAGGLALALLAATTIGADLARVASMKADASFFDALQQAFAWLKQRGLELAGGYVLASGVGALAVALAARGVGLCQVERAGALRVLGALVLHQAALGLLTLIQAAWTRRLYATPVSPRA
jgi:hypothetical protein